MISRADFDYSSTDPERLQKAQQAWVSLMISSKGVVFEIVEETDFPVQHCHSNLVDSRSIEANCGVLHDEDGAWGAPSEVDSLYGYRR